MKFHRTKLAGVFEIHGEFKYDERGCFGRCWCAQEFENSGLNPKTVQCNISINPRKGTLRGIHFQAAPYQEAKVVRCTRGAIYDVVVDLRPQSPTFKDWIAVTATDRDRNMIYIPEGCGHGFLTLEDDTEVFYQMSEFYKPELARGVRWDDPAFRITWPGKVELISERDQAYRDFS